VSFRVSARTLLQLGAELISSDGIAFYELIKNSFDARSPSVDLDIVARVRSAAIENSKRKLLSFQRNGKDTPLRALSRAQQDEVSSLLEQLRDAVVENSEGADEWISSLEKADTLQELIATVIDGNYIEVRDKGTGMSLERLRDVFLTIGTPFRANQRNAENGTERPILGEKGLGRLSAMRLGSRLRVETARASDARWSVLDVNWTDFDKLDDTLLEEVEVDVEAGSKKADPEQQGTTLHISDLIGDWTAGRLESIVTSEFSRLSDPFQKKRYRINVRFNGTPLVIPHFESLLFEHAHATLNATYGISGRSKRGPAEASLTVSLSYRPPNQTQRFRREIELTGVDLFSAAGSPSRAAVLRRLGPWTLVSYWFNRRYLTGLEGIGERGVVRELIRRWAGGVMVFRNGFRVNPYGGPGDDWLGLDQKAFGAKGFKLNRQQIIGKLDIAFHQNPHLQDQTNREGLRDTPEKVALVALLQKVFEIFRAFVNEIDKEVKASAIPTLADVTERLEAQDESLEEAWETLRQATPALDEDHPAIGAMRSAVEGIRNLIVDSQRLAQSYEKGHGDIVNLASVGLTVEILAHELTRATTGALQMLKLIRKSGRSSSSAAGTVSDREALEVLEEQLKTLSKRLRVLDPLSTSGRQRKEVFDLVEWVQTILGYHAAQFERHKIRCSFVVIPRTRESTMQVKMVKGMVVQIVENLISNSVYWLDQRKAYGDTFIPSITVELDRGKRELRFHDNGPGIGQDRGSVIFFPFNSTKPAGKGRGLGLYISREIAEYNGARLDLDDEPEEDGRLRTFILSLPADEQ